MKLDEKVKQKEKKEVVEQPEEKKPDSQGLVDRGIETAERLERANKKHEELLERQEALAVTNVLGGKSDAGQEPPKKKEISDKEYAEKAMSGELNVKEES